MLARLIRRLCLLILLATVASVPPEARAMVVVKRDFPELVARAEQIVIGTVTDISEAPDASGMPSTWVTFSDLTVLKGDVGTTFTLRLAGGATGEHFSVRVADMPTFQVGERAVLFVAGNGRDVCPLVGVWQGRFAVSYDTERGTDVVANYERRPVIGLAGRELRFAPLAPTSAAGDERATRPAAMTLDEFRQLIADEMAHPQAAGGVSD